MTEPDEDEVYLFMDRIREALAGEDAAAVIVALSGLIGEWAINASQGNAEVARAIVEDAYENTVDSVRRGAQAIADFRRQGLN